MPSNERYEGTRYAELAVTGSAEHLTRLRQVYRARRKAVIRYRGGNASESGDRIICPHAIVFADQMWYVVALCDDSLARFFRLDRVQAVSVLEETFESDDSALQRVMEQGRAFALDTARRMTVRYSPTIAGWIAEREGVKPADDGSVTLEHPLADDGRAIRHVLQYGPDAELLDPPELRTLLAQRLDTMLETTIP